MTWVAQILAALAVAVLRWYAGRKDLRDAERAKLALAAAEAAARALQWKTDHPGPVAPDLRDHLRVRDPDARLTLSPDDPPPPDVRGAAP